MSINATPSFRRFGSLRSLTIKNGKTNSARSVAALIQAVLKKKASRLMQEPVVMLKSQYFSMGWHTHAKPNAASKLYMTDTTMTVYTVARKILEKEKRR